MFWDLLVLFGQEHVDSWNYQFVYIIYSAMCFAELEYWRWKYAV
jgi:hypothetical protein